MKFKSACVDYTEQEFEALIDSIDDARAEDVRGELVRHFNKVVLHPSGSDLLFYPEDGADHSPSGVVQTIKDQRLSKGLPSFKDF